jgi:hypothetical protein
MKAKLIIENITCEECGKKLYRGFGILRCTTKTCSQYNIQYKFPCIKLEPVIKEKL